jgi:hypothetical protein
LGVITTWQKAGALTNLMADGWGRKKKRRKARFTLLPFIFAKFCDLPSETGR